jgi:serine phosphatase RsbU (regulator of sigma subunit)
MNAQEEMFGTQRLLGVCGRHYEDPPPLLLQAIFSALEEFSRGHCQHDDMAAAVFHWAE